MACLMGIDQEVVVSNEMRKNARPCQEAGFVPKNWRDRLAVQLIGYPETAKPSLVSVRWVVSSYARSMLANDGPSVGKLDDAPGHPIHIALCPLAGGDQAH